MIEFPRRPPTDDDEPVPDPPVCEHLEVECLDCGEILTAQNEGPVDE